MADSSRPTDTRPVVNATDARQGRYGRHMIWVLIGGLVLVVVAFAVIWGMKAPGFANANANNGPANVNSPAGPDPAQAFHAPEPAAQNPQPYQKDTPPETNHTSP